MDDTVIKHLGHFPPPPAVKQGEGGNVLGLRKREGEMSRGEMSGSRFPKPKGAAIGTAFGRELFRL